ncbi:MAG: hypothetical protein IPO92_18555 [Saprospiraceae bacterium]|nr:hypothetical protein [Saprospiraceae bacterium]
MASFSVCYALQILHLMCSVPFSTVSPPVDNKCLPPTTPLTVYFQKPAAWPNAKIYYWGATPAGSNENATAAKCKYDTYASRM